MTKTFALDIGSTVQNTVDVALRILVFAVICWGLCSWVLLEAMRARAGRPAPGD